MSLTLIILSKNNQQRSVFLVLTVLFLFSSVQDLCTESLVVDVLKRQFSLSKDIRALHKLLVRDIKLKRL